MGSDWCLGDNGLAGPCVGGAWVHGGSAVGDVVWGWNNFFCIRPGLVRLDLGLLVIVKVRRYLYDSLILL